jgi:hypothetical protein
VKRVETAPAGDAKEMRLRRLKIDIEQSRRSGRRFTVPSADLDLKAAMPPYLFSVGFCCSCDALVAGSGRGAPAAKVPSRKCGQELATRALPTLPAARRRCYILR